MSNKSLVALLCLAATPASVFAGSAINIYYSSSDAGFSSTTVVAPVGGNTGTTLGAQRMIAYQYAAQKWADTLTSDVPINIYAVWSPLACTASAATLGSARAWTYYANTPNIPKANRWYPLALAEKYAGARISSSYPYDIYAQFNVNLGADNCLTGVPFYLGLDGNHGSGVDLVEVLMHEFAHGLGFATATNGSTGAQPSTSTGLSMPHVWDDYLYDTTAGLTWANMTDAQRVTSSLNWGRLVWTGGQVTANIPQVLSAWVPRVRVTAPAANAGVYLVGTSSGFGAALTAPGVSAEVMPAIDNGATTWLGCSAFSGTNAVGISGKIAVLDRGTCGFAVKAKNAQNAGALGVVIIDSTTTLPTIGMSGTDTTVTIPAVMISHADGALLKKALSRQSRLHSGVYATVGLDTSMYQGADPGGYAQMYAPNPFASGSSVSHFSTAMSRNQLMEPNISSDLTQNVKAPYDLTWYLLLDIGWN